MTSRKATRLRDCEQGVTTVEFAIILVPLLLFLLGGLELAYRSYAISVLNGGLRTVSRMASTGQFTGSQIDSTMKSTVQNFRSDATVTIVKKSYSDFTGVGVEEPITSGSQASHYCYQDINNNGSWDADQGTSGLGNPDDVVYYDVTVTYKTLFPFNQAMLGFGSDTTIEANTLMSNEPFAPPVNEDPPTRCV